MGELEDRAAAAALAYRAAVRPELWPEALARLGRLAGGDLTLWEEVDRVTGRTLIGFSDQPRLLADTRDAYESHYAALNIRGPVGERLPHGVVFSDDEVGDERTLDASEYYTDFLGPVGLRYFLGVALESTPERQVRLSVQRAAGRGRATLAERRALEAALPDFSNAFQMWRRLSERLALGAVFGEVFEHLAQPLAVLGGDGRLRAANFAMRELLAEGRLVRAADTRLVGVTAPARRALQSVLRCAGAGPVAAACAPVDCDAPAAVLRAAPLDACAAGELGPAEPSMLLMIDAPARPRAPSPETVRAVFGLTRAEAAVAVRLAEGLVPVEIARRLGVSHNTVRTHLAALRAKLGVASQVAIVAQVRRASAPFE